MLELNRMPSNRPPIPQTIPRMPFASPDVESLESPALSSYSSFGQISSREGPHKENERALTGNQGGYNKGTPKVQSAKAEPRPTRIRMPELNLVTRFTNDTQLISKPALSNDTNATSVVKKQSAVHLSNTGSSDAVTRPGHRHQRFVQHKKALGSISSIKDGTKGPVGGLQRVDSKLWELSPSDRTLVIGISFPSLNLGGQQTDSSGILRAPGNHREIPLTPEIMITPAKLDDNWSPDRDKKVPWNRRRAASSVYSQAPLYHNGVTRTSEIPPVPLPPSRLLSQAVNSVSVSNISTKPHERICSWDTEFDEDESPKINSRSRPYSGESQLVILNRASIDTVATRHRSKGWWTQIVSPFFERFPNNISKQSPTGDEKGVISSSSTIIQDDTQSPKFSDDKAINSLGQMKVNAQRESGSSIWTDMSRWEAERRTMAFAFDDTRNRGTGGPKNTQTQHPLSPEFVATTGFGAASEYFEACWHDQNSPTPFFMCQNHECSWAHSSALHAEDEGGIMRGLEEQDALGRSGFRGKKDELRGNDLFRQTPASRFSAAFAEVAGQRRRPMSDATEIEEDPEVTPEVQEAQVAPIVRAKSPVGTVNKVIPQQIQLRDVESIPKEVTAVPQLTPAMSQQLPPYSPPRSEIPVRRYMAVMPPDHPQADPPVQSAPETTGNIDRAVPLTSMPRDMAPRNVQNTYVHQYYEGRQNTISREENKASESFPPPPKPWSKAEEKKYLKEKKEERSNNEARAKPKGGCSIWLTPKDKKKRRRCYLCLIIGLLAMIALIIALAMTLTRKQSDMPVQSSWLNITGYPPIPTGISTVARPDAVNENTGCVHPSTMWSCALPKEQQPSIAPNDPDQPNFRIEIRFQNGTITNNVTTHRSRRKRSSIAVSAKEFLQRNLLHRRDAFTDNLFVPNPSPPSQENQAFLGNTTDGNSIPFDGEFTPFYISLLPTTPTPMMLLKRQNQNTSTSDPFPNITNAIPPPSLNPDGTAASANLLPFLTAQPLRLYNRHSPQEHYGFYTYFDRSIFLKSTALLNDSNVNLGPVPDDENGGSEENAATVRCTWAQTRFLVQIWTNQGSSTSLLPSLNSTDTSSPTSNTNSSSASDFVRPGSFPYPVTISLDRHGGDITKKMIYCYGLDDREHVLSDQKKIQLEDRGFGGLLVNPTLGVFGNVNISIADGGPGGVDGGTGGCKCSWQNWRSVR